MPEVYRIWRNKLFKVLKDRIKGNVTVEINEDTASLYLAVEDSLGKFERGIFNLDGRMLVGDFNAELEAKKFINAYKLWILGRFVN
jgi:hypothetical protein